MPKPTNIKLYEQVKKEMKGKYEELRSPFLSGAIVAEYKKRGGKYVNDDKERKLDRWFKEKWVNINPIVGITDDKAYAFFRPTVQVSEKTPALAQEISKPNLKTLVKKKQKKKYGKNVEEEIIGGGAKVLMDKKDFLKEHKKLINLLNMGKKFTDEAKDQLKEVKNTQYIGGMIVQSQPYSKGRFTNFN